jgi:uncharacterized damage-inducible protein DinB
MKKNGMLIALMDEYRKAAIEYKQILTDISQVLFIKITDDKTKDKDCKSIQNITFHIIQSGYTYSNYINTVNKREWFEYKEDINNPKKGIEEIDKMLDFTENSFDGIWTKSNKEIEKWKFDTRWNVTYDFEQLMEHAIVHVLRHRRQIENVIKNNG